MNAEEAKQVVLHHVYTVIKERLEGYLSDIQDYCEFKDLPFFVVEDLEKNGYSVDRITDSKVELYYRYFWLYKAKKKIIHVRTYYKVSIPEKEN